MKQLLKNLLIAALLCGFAATASAVEAVTKNGGDQTLTAGFILKSGDTIMINSGANIVNNGTATGFGAGTVTSVGLTLPPIFGTGTPVTTSGNLTASLTAQAAHALLIGPTTGADAAPTFRALLAADLPDLSGVYSPLAGSASLTTFSGGTLTGTAALAASSGGNGSGDSGLVALFDSSGRLNTSLGVTIQKGVYSHLLQTAIMTAARTWSLPDVTGTIITTGNLSAITTTGIVTSGTWSGSFGAVSGANLTTLNASNISSGSLALARIAQSGATSGQALAWNGSAWAPATIASGLTIGSTAITGGTSGRLLTSGTTVGELTLGSNVATWLATPSKANLDSAVSATLATTGANTFTADQNLGTSSVLFTDGSGSIGGAGGGRPSTIYCYNGITCGSLSAANAIATGGNAVWYWTSQMIMETAVDGSLKLSNWGRTGFGLLQLGGYTSSFPALKQTGAGITIRLADDSANAALTTGSLTLGATGTPSSKLKHGVATLAAGTVTVSDSDVVEAGTPATSSRIFITRMTDGGTIGDSFSITRTNATSFTITAKTAGVTASADTSVVSWLMINP